MQISQPSKIVRPKFRSIKYSINRKKSTSKYLTQQNAEFFNRNSCIINTEKFEPTKQSLIKRSQSHNTNKTGKLDDIYLRTFTTFMSRNYIKSRNEEDKQNYSQIKITIPQYNDQFDQEPSDFTFFDPMTKPIKYIDNQITCSQKELKRQSNDILMLRSELDVLRNFINSKIDEMSGQTLKKVNELKTIFNKHQSSENQNKLRNKRQIRLLQKADELQKKTIQNLKDRNLQIQQHIFNCHPLQLQFHQTPILQINQNEYL